MHMRKANKSGCGQTTHALSLATPLQNFWISAWEHVAAYQGHVTVA